MVSTKTLASDFAPLVWPATQWLLQVSSAPATRRAVRSVTSSPTTRKVLNGVGVMTREIIASMAVQSVERAVYYPPPSTYSEGSDMSFGRAARDPDLKNLQKLTDKLLDTAEVAEEERDLKEYVVREVREVLVKAANQDDAIKVAKVAFKYGQDADNKIDRDYLPWDIKGNTIDKIRRVSIRAIRHFS
jgi:hypothetical protein